MASPAADFRGTYRLQLTAEFGFEHARRLVPYLRDLGISHLYLSPSLQARDGSKHGYDVIDPTRLSDALGGEHGFRALAAEAHESGLGILLDTVPNHMAATDANPFWADEARRAKFFDIDPATGRHRRFFDVDDLAGVRQEDPEVFEATHALTLSLVQEGLVDGLRVDHPDGLANPEQYLVALREGGARRVWVEKILSSSQPPERLRPSWPVNGTVGYEFLTDLCAAFIDPAGEEPLTALWERVSGDRRPFAEWALEAKRELGATTFAPELERLGRLAPELSSAALLDAVAGLSIYRTYIDPSTGMVAGDDLAALAAVPAEVADRLLGRQPAPAEFVTRFQQTTPAVVAKGVEDTASYRYCRLLALNDVGGDPGRFGIDVTRFHEGNALRAEHHPLNLLASTTHDTKRSADVRARIGAISLIATDWSAAVERWMAISERWRSPAGAPDDIERLFIFQTLAGTWPIEPERIDAYLEKALREAKRNTSWISPDADWEQAVRRFARELTHDDAFLTDFEPVVARLATLGGRASLAQVVLKLTCPGIPDIYQGDELEYRALVDPDNRRPVDWDLRSAELRRLMGGGRPGPEARKLWVIARLLGLRARRPEAFGAGAGYEPLDAGPDACAFVRGGGVLVVCELRPGAGGALRGTPGGEWREVLTGAERSFDRAVAVADAAAPEGAAVYERL